MGRIAMKLAGVALLVSCGANAGADAERDTSATASKTAAMTTASPTKQAPPAGRKTIPGAAGSGCRASEIKIFQCRTKEAKTIAVCSTGGDTATYRFGAAKPEIEIEGGRWARTAYSGGGELQIAFTRDPYRYVVFSRMVRTNFEPDEPNYPASADGVLVLRGEKFVGMKLCDPDAEMAEYDESAEGARAKLPEERDLFTYETSRANP